MQYYVVPVVLRIAVLRELPEGCVGDVLGYAVAPIKFPQLLHKNILSMIHNSRNNTNVSQAINK